MKYYVYHYRGLELEIPGVYQEGVPDDPKMRDPHYIDLTDEEFGSKILELSHNYDIMVTRLSDGKPSLLFDQPGAKFRR